MSKKLGVSKAPVGFSNLLEQFSEPSKKLYNSLPLSIVLLSTVSVTPTQPPSENIKWKSSLRNNP